MKHVRLVVKLLLGLALIYAGIGHLTFSRIAFQAQVPPWLPMDADLVVVLSGFVEIVLGLGLIILKKWERRVGIVVSLFFLAVFPGNISQFLTHTDAFGLNSDSARAVRLVFQPVLVLWALWSTGFFKPRKT
ncbi:MAG: hypothetical protein NTX78_04590 [Rhodoluna sp.]|nr:hypothetical protein [Rhodoluna sp.]